MSRKAFLTFAAMIACSIGLIAIFLPTTLLLDMKYTTANDSGLVMARTAGVFLFSFGILNFFVRNHANSPTMTSLLLVNALLQLLILPVDPIAYVMGIYGSPLSFVPNTILHFILLFGFLYYWKDSKNLIPAYKTY